MCQSRQFVVTLEEKNLFSKNDKNATNESISTVCHIRSRLLSYGRLQTLRFLDVVLLVLLLRRFAVIVSQINHGKANDSNNGYSREIPYNTTSIHNNIASLLTKENHISIHTSQNCQLKNNSDCFSAIR